MIPTSLLLPLNKPSSLLAPILLPLLRSRPSSACQKPGPVPARLPCASGSCRPHLGLLGISSSLLILAACQFPCRVINSRSNRTLAIQLFLPPRLARAIPCS